jgi:hypothetical protein
MAGSRIMPVAIIALVILVGVVAIAAFYYYGQLNDANSVIQKSLYESTCNYTVVVASRASYICSDVSCSSSDVSGPYIQNISIVPLDAKLPDVSDLITLNSIPLPFYDKATQSNMSLFPNAIAYEFHNFNTTVSNYSSKQTIGSYGMYYLDDYYNYTFTGQIVIIYSIYSQLPITFNVATSNFILVYNGKEINPIFITETDIVSGIITLEPANYTFYKISVLSDASEAKLQGSFVVNSIENSTNDIIVYVMDSANFTKWQNGEQASMYYNSGKINANISAITSFNLQLTPGMSYYLVYDNTFSNASQKSVATDVSLIVNSTHEEDYLSG